MKDLRNRVIARTTYEVMDNPAVVMSTQIQSRTVTFRVIVRTVQVWADSAIISDKRKVKHLTVLQYEKACTFLDSIPMSPESNIGGGT